MFEGLWEQHCCGTIRRHFIENIIKLKRAKIKKKPTLLTLKCFWDYGIL